MCGSLLYRSADQLYLVKPVDMHALAPYGELRRSVDKFTQVVVYLLVKLLPNPLNGRAGYQGRNAVHAHVAIRSGRVEVLYVQEQIPAKRGE